jgi:hypothetical protein
MPGEALGLREHYPDATLGFLWVLPPTAPVASADGKA